LELLYGIDGRKTSSSPTRRDNLHPLARFNIPNIIVPPMKATLLLLSKTRAAKRPSFLNPNYEITPNTGGLKKLQKVGGVLVMNQTLALVLDLMD
jgi:hypothetical protein